MKAIETRYKGYRFRSRLEARWAVFFDALKIGWEYEPEGYELKDGTRYLPDFKLLDTGQVPDIYIEIKGSFPLPARDAQKLWDFSSELLLQGRDVGFLIIVGPPGGCLGPAFLDGAFNGRRTNGVIEVTEFLAKGYKLGKEDLTNAIDAARAARFEFGEQG